MLALVYAFDKFRVYLVGTNIIVQMDNTAIRYLFSKKDIKTILRRYILLLQEFNLVVRDRKGAENHMAD